MALGYSFRVLPLPPRDRAWAFHPGTRLKSVQRCLRHVIDTARCGSRSIVVVWFRSLTATCRWEDHQSSYALPHDHASFGSSHSWSHPSFRIFPSLCRPDYKDPFLATHGVFLTPPSLPKPPSSSLLFTMRPAGVPYRTSSSSPDNSGGLSSLASLRHLALILGFQPPLPSDRPGAATAGPSWPVPSAAVVK